MLTCRLRQGSLLAAQGLRAMLGLSTTTCSHHQAALTATNLPAGMHDACTIGRGSMAWSPRNASRGRKAKLQRKAHDVLASCMAREYHDLGCTAGSTAVHGRAHYGHVRDGAP